MGASPSKEQVRRAVRRVAKANAGEPGEVRVLRASNGEVAVMWFRDGKPVYGSPKSKKELTK